MFASRLSFGSEPLTLPRVRTLPRGLGCTFTCLCLLSSTLVGCQRGSSASDLAEAKPPAEVQTGSPSIDFDSRVHDFGAVNEGAMLKHVFTVRNTGTSLLKVNNVATSCGCTAAALAVRELPPGGSGPIDVTFDTHGFQGMGSKTITVDSNDKLNPRSSLEIKYNVERLLALERVFVRLETKRGADSVERVWLTGKLTGEAKPRVTNVEGDDKQVLVKTIKARQDGKTRKGLEIRLKGNKLVSRYGDITIETGLSNPAELVLRFNATVN